MLTQLSLFWFETLARRRAQPRPERHRFPGAAAALQPSSSPAASMLCRKTKPLPVECVVRGYLVGLGLEGLPRQRQSLRHRACRPGLRESDRLPEPIFTPSTKATAGHDENISFDEVVARIGGRARRAAPRTSAWKSTAAPRPMPSRAASCWPTPNLSSA